MVCGASMCSVDVFLSSTFPRTGEPEMLMGLSSAISPLPNGNEAVATSGSLAACGGMEACTFILYRDGTSLRELTQ